MHDIVIDGVRYVPDSSPSPRIGVGVTTHNRDVLAKTLEQIRKHTPGAKVVVVDDASSKPPESDYRFESNVGIAVAKNKCLELLEGCEHIFLFDDDCYPVADGWWKPYVESPEPHLMFGFLDVSKGKALGDTREIYRDSRHVAYDGPRGCMLYADRKVLDVVGGMDPVFGRWGWEHVDWSNRIHHAGLTTWRYADVVGSESLIYSLDQHLAVERSVPVQDRTNRADDNANIANTRRDTLYEARVNYRQTSNVVLTTLLTSNPDPQRGSRMKADPSLLARLRSSLGAQKLVVLHDQLTPTAWDNTEWVKVEAKINPYFQRHIAAYQYLRDHPEVEFAWCVDGTDVEMLHNPFPEMERGALYLGSEPAVVGIDWMLSNHPAVLLQDFLKANAHRPLLNAGLIGGDRETLLAFLHRMVTVYFDDASHYNYRNDIHGKGLGVGDMATLNYVAYTWFADRIVQGPRINTVFKANERNEWSWWKHK